MNRWLKHLSRIRRPSGKAAVGIALLALGLWVAIGPGRGLLDREQLLALLSRPDYPQEVLFLGIFAVLTVLGTPGSILAVAGGLVFGILWGTIWATIGATIGAIVTFWLSRYLLHGWAAKRWSAHPLLQRCRQAIARRPLQVVLVARLAPVAPFALVNYLLGLTDIGWLPYTVGTFFGILPSTLALVWLGVAGKEAASGGNWLPLAGVILALALLSALPILLGRSGRGRYQD